MLGHVLRMTNDTQTKLAIQYFNRVQSGEGFRGRPETTLTVIINRELKTVTEHHINTVKKLKLLGQLKQLKDLKQLISIIIIFIIIIIKLTLKRMNHFF